MPIEERLLCLSKAEEAKSAKKREECTAGVLSPWKRLQRMDTWMLLVVGPLAVYLLALTGGKLAMWTWKGFRS